MRRAVVPADRAAEIVVARDGVVLEAVAVTAAGSAGGSTGGGPGRVPPAIAAPAERLRYAFEQASGPLASYRRTVEVAPAADGQVEVTQEVALRVGIPYVAWLFALPVRGHLGSLLPRSRAPWWAPPARLSHTQAVTLATLCALSAVAGYMGDLLPIVMTYAGREFGVGSGGQGVALGVVQVNAVLAMVLLARADQRGRRRLIIGCSFGGLVLTAAGALSPSLAVLTTVQVAAAALVTAQGVLLGIVAVEEMPKGGRAWAIALISMSYGLGGGIALALLPLADEGLDGWRLIFAAAVIGVPAVISCARHLPESTRWRDDVVALPAPPGRARRWELTPTERKRLLILGAGALLFALFDAPGGQLQNQYLRTQRHWTAVRISVAEQIAGTVGGLGTLVGGRLADTHGRRPVAAVAVAAGTAVTLLQYFTSGNALYVWMTLASILGYAVTPALAVYGAELFASSRRGKVGGALTILGAVGGFAGLAATGLLAEVFGTIGPALAVMAVGPLALVVLIVVAYPETAGRSLEELNEPDPAGVTGTAQEPG